MLLLSPGVLAQQGDWRAVERLKPGSRISVTTEAQGRIVCAVEGATDSELFCAPYRGWPRSSSTLRIPRAEIDEVRKLPHPNQAKDAAIGAAIGGGAAAVAAGATANNYPGVHALVGGAGGAGFGALIGAMVPIFQLAFQRAKVIYRR